jgi:hypothetical protein
VKPYLTDKQHCRWHGGFADESAAGTDGEIQQGQIPKSANVWRGIVLADITAVISL